MARRLTITHRLCQARDPENGADIEHINHAVTMLEPGRRLVAVCANGPRQNDTLRPLCDEWHDLKPDTFKEAETGANTALIIITAWLSPQRMAGTVRCSERQQRHPNSARTHPFLLRRRGECFSSETARTLATLLPKEEGAVYPPL